MATYSSAPQYEIVQFERSVNNIGNSHQSQEFELVTVPANTIYQPLNCFLSVDSGGGGVSLWAKVKDGYMTTGGMINTGDDELVHSEMLWIARWLGLNVGNWLLEENNVNSNATASGSNFHQLLPSDVGSGYRYYTGQTIVGKIYAYEADVAGEQVAFKMSFLKTTYP